MAQPAPVRKRITPIAVDPLPAEQNISRLDTEGPLSVGPAPDQGDARAVHPKLGPGRHMWVDIQTTYEVKLKQVLRQQGLDHNTWRKEQEQQYNKLYRDSTQAGDTNKKQRLTTGMLLQRVQGMYQIDESDGDDEGEGSSSEDESGDEAEGDGEEEEEEGAEEPESDDAEDGANGDEIDLDKEAEAEAARGNNAKPKRQRFERYDEDFIDDSELEIVKGGVPKRTKYSGFYVNQGNIEVLDEPTKPRARRAPKAADAAGGSGAGSRKRKQQQQQPQAQQPQQQQQHVSDGDATDAGAAGGKKKRSRANSAPASDTNAAAAAPASKKARKASPATSEAAAGAATAAAAGDPGTGAGAGGAPAPAAAAAGSGVAKQALAAALAASRKRQPTATAAAAGGGGSAAAGVRSQSPAPSGLPPLAPTASKADAAAATAAAAAAKPGPQQHQEQQQQQDQGQQQSEQASQEAQGTQRQGKQRRRSPSPSLGGAGGGAAAAAEGDAPWSQNAASIAGAAAAAGLPDELVGAVVALQRVVQEHKPAAPGPSGGTANLNIGIKKALHYLAFALARLPDEQQQQQGPQLLSVVGPLMAPYMNEKKLKKALMDDGAKRLNSFNEVMEPLKGALSDMKGAASGGAGASVGSGSDDDFQQCWSQSAEDALVEAWKAVDKLMGQQGINSLALEVCQQLGISTAQDQPDKAVAEVLQVYKKAKRRHSAATKAANKAAAAAAAAGAGTGSQQPPQQQQQQQGSHDSIEEHSRPPSPSPAAAAAAGASGGGAIAATPPKQGRGGSSSSAVRPDAADGGGAGGDGGGQAAAAQKLSHSPFVSVKLVSARSQEQQSTAATGGSEGASQQTKPEFSQWSARSPRLQRCVDAAIKFGADEAWLQEKYATLPQRSAHMHKMFRALCVAGPGGCSIKDFVSVSDAAELGISWDNKTSGRSHLKQSLRTQVMSNIAGTTEVAPHNKYALLCYPGVAKQAPKAPRTGQSGQTAPAEAGTGAGSAAAELPAE